MIYSTRRLLLLVFVLVSTRASASGGDIRQTDGYTRLKQRLDAVPAIDTHSHLRGPQHYQDLLHRAFRGDKPSDCPLAYVWRVSYFTGGHPLAAWPQDGRFDTWWTAAQIDFRNGRARSAYRTMLPIFQDLYGMDFETLSLEQARQLNARMEKNLEQPDWAEEVLRHRAHTELIVVDSFVTPQAVRDHLPFTVSACSVRHLVDGFHPSEFVNVPAHDPYAFAAARKLPVNSLDEYLAVVDRLIAETKQAGAISLKNHTAYDRTLQFDRVTKQQAEQAFGKPRDQLSPEQVKAFQDYIFWQLAELAAKHSLPFQIHTGHANIPGSNPMNLVPLIEANPRTRFILFHGGFPWVGETGMIALKYRNVWLDSVWLPVLSHTMGKRALQEWLDMFSSNRIMWGSDMCTVEGTYGTTIYTRQCITEALAEKVINKGLREEDAVRIGRQILRENALKLFPSLRQRVRPWSPEGEQEPKTDSVAPSSSSR